MIFLKLAQPVDTGIFGIRHHQNAVIVDVFKNLWGTPCLQVLRRCTDDYFLLGYRFGDQAGIFQCADTQCKVVAFFNNIQRPVGDVQLEADIRILLRKIIENARQLAAAKVRHGGDAQSPPRGDIEVGNQFFGFGNRFKDVFTMLIKHLARFCWADRTGGAVQ